MTARTASALQIGAGPAVTVTQPLAEEEPVALVYDGTTQAVMMATPADLADFAMGFSLTEGIVTTPAQVTEMSIERHDAGIEVRMWLAAPAAAALTTRRRAMAGPVGCGLCGIDSLAEATRPLPRVTARPALSVSQIITATDLLRAAQPLHDDTRAVHAAGFMTQAGLVLAREDVGRHNALDKVIGALARQGIDPAGGALVMTSRLSVELVQKCALAGCGMLIAVSAPTARAVSTARDAGITLVARARDGTAQVFTHPDRIPGTLEGTDHVA